MTDASRKADVKRKASARRVALAQLLLMVLLIGARESAAVELWSKGDSSLEFSGSLRQIVLYSKQTEPGAFEEPSCRLALTVADCPAWEQLGETHVGQALTRLRMRLDVQVTSWLSAAIAYDSQAFVGRIDTLESELGRSQQADSFFGAEGEIASGQHVVWTHRLYRGFLQADVQLGDQSAFARVGRQKVSWGVGNLWNPIDRFDPTPPLAVQGDENSGIDAALVRWGWSGFDFLEGVYAPGTSSSEARYAAHVHAVVFDTDISLMGGVYQEAPTVGFDIARNLGGAGIYLEAVWADPRKEVWRIGAPSAPPDDFWQVVAGVHHMFDIGTGLYVLLEHLYNGNALGFGGGKAGTYLNFFETADLGLPALAAVPASNAIAGSSGVVTFSENQTGLEIGYDLTPEVRVDFLVLYDWNGKSAAFVPNVSYAALDALELRLGAQLFAGPRLSQYGSNEHLVYFLADFFF